MKLATAHFPRQKQSTAALTACYILAIIIIIMTVSQLMTVEKTLPILENYLLPGRAATAKAVLFFELVAGVFALPFLLRMKVSPLFRLLSVFLLFVFASTWVLLSLWVMATEPPYIGSGMFGSFFSDIAREGTLLIAAMLFSYACVATWVLRNDLSFQSKT